jgi:putative flippase GtrA
MISYTKKRVEALLKVEFIRFCIVGGTGFLINLVFLALLPKLFGFPVPVAQFIGAEIALFSNFMLHHHWTYTRHKVKKSMRVLIIQFHLTTWPAILGSVAMVSISVEFFHLGKIVALIISSAISLIWNYFWSKYVVWRDVSPKEIEKLT